MVNNKEPVALIMAGGSGTRFWPLSQAERPKQFLSLFGDGNEGSLIQASVKRLLPLIPTDRIAVCCREQDKALAQEQLPTLSHFFLEPQGKNTAPCLMFSLRQFQLLGVASETVMVVLPADHHIADPATFRQVLMIAIPLAQETSGLVTLGIRPTSPHTGYGYIESELPLNPKGAHVLRFVEKPDLETAKLLSASNHIYWNSGIFVWTLGALEKAFQTLQPKAWQPFAKASSHKELSSLYGKVESVSIDTFIMERANNTYVVPASFGWSDVGSWNALYELSEKNKDHNVLNDGHRAVESSGCLVKTDSQIKVSLVGLRDIVVVQQGSDILVLDRKQDQLVKKLI